MNTLAHVEEEYKEFSSEGWKIKKKKNHFLGEKGNFRIPQTTPHKRQKKGGQSAFFFFWAHILKWGVDKIPQKE